MALFGRYSVRFTSSVARVFVGSTERGTNRQYSLGETQIFEIGLQPTQPLPLIRRLWYHVGQWTRHWRMKWPYFAKSQLDLLQTQQVCGKHRTRYEPSILIGHNSDWSKTVYNQRSPWRRFVTLGHTYVSGPNIGE